MSEVKDRHWCGECKWLINAGNARDPRNDTYICLKLENEFPHAIIEPGDEACSEFEPRRGWQD